MKYIPILLNSEMVNAILQGKKTQTRRIVRNDVLKQRPNNSVGEDEKGFYSNLGGTRFYQLQPKANIGDVFWVREGWTTESSYDATKPSLIPKDALIFYIADEEWDYYALPGKKRPSIFMPKWVCRLFLEVTDVRLERLQDISYKDARSEGIKKMYPNKESGKLFRRYFNYHTSDYTCISSILSFKSLWQSINGKNSWYKNPYVWVYEFKVVEKPENFGK